MDKKPFVIYVQCCRPLYYEPQVWQAHGAPALCCLEASGNPVITLEKIYIFALFSALSFYTRKTNWSLQMADKAIGHKARATLLSHNLLSLFSQGVISNSQGKTRDIIWGHTSWQTATFVILSGLPRRKRQGPVVKFWLWTSLLKPKWKCALECTWTSPLKKYHVHLFRIENVTIFRKYSDCHAIHTQKKMPIL